eukprot:scaffold24_cov186-Alexandrium_tamarense.AAC.49
MTFEGDKSGDPTKVSVPVEGEGSASPNTSNNRTSTSAYPITQHQSLTANPLAPQASKSVASMNVPQQKLTVPSNNTSSKTTPASVIAATAAADAHSMPPPPPVAGSAWGTSISNAASGQSAGVASNGVPTSGANTALVAKATVTSAVRTQVQAGAAHDIVPVRSTVSAGTVAAQKAQEVARVQMQTAAANQAAARVASSQAQTVGARSAAHQPTPNPMRPNTVTSLTAASSVAMRSNLPPGTVIRKPTIPSNYCTVARPTPGAVAASRPGQILTKQVPRLGVASTGPVYGRAPTQLSTSLQHQQAIAKAKAQQHMRTSGAMPSSVPSSHIQRHAMLDLEDSSSADVDSHLAMLPMDIASMSENIPKNTKSKSKGNSHLLRRGKWTNEEEAYATKLINEFKGGLLPLTDGTTLRNFLSKLLNCDPMRISKKFVGNNCIGKQVFRRRAADINRLTLEEMRETSLELSE